MSTVVAAEALGIDDATRARDLLEMVRSKLDGRQVDATTVIAMAQVHAILDLARAIREDGNEPA